MKINWRVRINNKQFWIEIIPALLLVLQLVLDLFGVQMDFGDLGNKLIGIVNAAFVVLALLGIVTDPTTPGVEDSARVMTYVEPGVPGKE